MKIKISDLIWLKPLLKLKIAGRIYYEKVLVACGNGNCNINCCELQK